MNIDVQQAAPKTYLLGEILIRRGIITEQRLKEALEAQKSDGGYLGEILIQKGYVQERDIVVALIVQCNLPYIAIDKYSIDQEILDLIPRDLALAKHVVPLDKVGNVLSVVMENPLDNLCKSELQRITNCYIAPFIATKAEINCALEKNFGKKS